VAYAPTRTNIYVKTNSPK